MKHHITSICLVMATLAVPFVATSAVADDSGLAGCARIASPLDRLECYDALARAADASIPVAKSAPTPASQSAPAPAPAAPAPAPAVAQAPGEPAPLVDAPENFGFENQLFKTRNQEIVARYEGQFSGWSGGTLFKLDNGQVWKQAQSGRVSHRRDNPVITIRKGALGSFRLSVEGLNRTVRVKRIK